MSRQRSEEQRAEALRLYAKSLAYFGRRVRQVADGQWSEPTPCARWSVRDLVNHVAAEELWVPAMVGGSTIEEVGDRFDGDVLGADPGAVWAAAEAAAREAVAEDGALARTVHLSYGDTSALAYCRQLTSDATVHGWDLSRAIGADPRIAEDLVAASIEEVTPYAPALAATGLFAPPVEVAQGASPQTRLLALLGRRSGWRPPG